MFYLIFAQNIIDFWVHVRTASVPTIYVFRAKKKIIYTPVNPNFTLYKWGVMGSTLSFVLSDNIKFG